MYNALKYSHINEQSNSVASIPDEPLRRHAGLLKWTSQGLLDTK